MKMDEFAIVGRKPNHEKARVDTLVPQYLRNSAANAINFLQEYYDYLNRDSQGATLRLSQLVSENDIDQTSAKYLDAIQAEIASIVPNSDYITDRVTLYKRIVHFYRSKGSQESVNTFFRIFFGEAGIPTISYGETPYTYSLATSSFPSEWREKYKRLVHPAGLQFLVDLLLYAVVRGGGDDTGLTQDASLVKAGWDADYYGARVEDYLSTASYVGPSLKRHLPVTSAYHSSGDLSDVGNSSDSGGSFGALEGSPTENADGTFTFDGVDDRVTTGDMPGSGGFNSNDDWTISFMFKGDGSQSLTPIVVDSSNLALFSIYKNSSDQIVYETKQDAVSPATRTLVADYDSTTAIRQVTITNTADSQGGATARIYIDDRLYGSRADADFDGDSQAQAMITALMYGELPISGGSSAIYGKGVFKEFRFFNKALSGRQVRDLWLLNTKAGGDLTGHDWYKDLVPPYRRADVADSQDDPYSAYMLPKYQPGWLEYLDLVKILASADANDVNDSQDRVADIKYAYNLKPAEIRDAYFRRRYQGMLKYYDPGPIAGYGDRTVAESIAAFEQLNSLKLYSFGADVTSVYYTLATDVDSQQEGGSFTLTMTSSVNAPVGAAVYYDIENVESSDLDGFSSADVDSQGNVYSFFVPSPILLDGRTSQTISKDLYYYSGDKIYKASTAGTSGTTEREGPKVTVAAPASGTQATATCTISNGTISTITVTGIGDGYDSQGEAAVTITPPAIKSSDGSTVFQSGVLAIAVGSGGSGYTSAPTVTIAAPSDLSVVHGGVQATAYATLSGDAVASVTVVNPGLGYSSAPSVTFSGGGGSGASATASLIDMTLDSQGNDIFPLHYETATATATVIGGSVSEITINNRGLGYSYQLPTGTSDVDDGDITWTYASVYPNTSKTFTLTADSQIEADTDITFRLQDYPTVFATLSPFDDMDILTIAFSYDATDSEGGLLDFSMTFAPTVDTMATSIPWAIDFADSQTDVDSQDFNGALSGNFTRSGAATDTISLETASDYYTEGSETVRIVVGHSWVGNSSFSAGDFVYYGDNLYYCMTTGSKTGATANPGHTASADIVQGIKLSYVGNSHFAIELADVFLTPTIVIGSTLASGDSQLDGTGTDSGAFRFVLYGTNIEDGKTIPFAISGSSLGIATIDTASGTFSFSSGTANTGADQVSYVDPGSSGTDASDAVTCTIGTAWGAGSLTSGSFVYNGANLYVVGNDGTAVTAPTHGSGTTIIDDIRYTYVGPATYTVTITNPDA